MYTILLQIIIMFPCKVDYTLKTGQSSLMYTILLQIIIMFPCKVDYTLKTGQSSLMYTILLQIIIMFPYKVDHTLKTLHHCLHLKLNLVIMFPCKEGHTCAMKLIIMLSFKKSIAMKPGHNDYSSMSSLQRIMLQ